MAADLELVAPDPAGCSSRPGFSWHQWGRSRLLLLAADDKAEWSTTKKVGGLNAYRVYAAEAEAVGLVAGGHWSSFKDWPHVQLRPAASPTGTLTVLKVDAAMRERFGV